MTHYFTKIDVDLSNSLIDGLKGNHFTDISDYFQLFDIKNKYIDSIMAKFPPGMRSYITRVNYSEITDDVTPHRDIASCMLNYYITPHSALTTFYNTRPETKENIYTYGSRSIITYNVDDLDCADTFVAEKNSCYLLNVAEIHSVTRLEKNKRSLLQFRFQIGMTYRQAYEICNLNNIVVNDQK